MKKVVVSLAASLVLTASIAAAPRDRESPRGPGETVIRRAVDGVKRLLPKLVKPFGDWPIVPPPSPGP